MSISAQLDPTVLHSDEVLGEIALLRAIDRAILEIGDDTPVEEIEDLFTESVAEFCHLHGLTRPPICLVFMGSEFQPLRPPATKNSAKSVPLTESLLPLIEFGGASCSRSIERDDDQALFKSIGAAGACLAGPVYTPGRHLLCVLIAAGASSEQWDLLRQPRLREAFDGLMSQLTIAYRQFERARFHSELHGLWAEFLAHNLSPTICFRSLAKHISRFLPTFGPLRAIDSSLQTQILMLPDAPEGASVPEHLVIRGTTGTEHSGTRVAVDRSISGILIAEPGRPFFCDDPTAPNYRRLYRNYFGNPEHKARTELAVRMNVAGQCVGIINIESRLKDAFSFLHQQTLLELAGTFGRFASVLEQRLMMNTEMQHSVATSTRNYLDALASTFRHGIATPLAAQRLDADNLARQIEQAEDIAERIAEATDPGSDLRALVNDLDRLVNRMRASQLRLSGSRNETAQYSGDFVNDISGYADEGQLVLREIVDAAIQLVDNCLLGGKARHTRIKVTGDSSLKATRIYCSTLIKQHFYSIFHNAVDAISERMKSDDRPGRITVRISEEEIPEGQEQRLNKAWVVRIRDNGLGVNAKQLVDLRKFDPGTTFKGGGHGYGLTAAQRYVASIGGRIELVSVLGKFFEVALYLDEYNPAIHGRRRRLSSKGGIYG